MSELQIMESKLAEMGHRAMGAESELLEAREKIEHLEKLLAKARGAGKGKSPVGSTEAERELIKTREALDNLRDAHAQLAKEMIQVKEDLGKAQGSEPSAELVAAREVARQLRAKIVELEDAAVDKADDDLRAVEDELSDLREDAERKDREVSRLEDQLGEAEEELEKVQAKLDNLRVEVDPAPWEQEREGLRTRIVESVLEGRPVQLDRATAERLRNLELYAMKSMEGRVRALQDI